MKRTLSVFSSVVVLLFSHLGAADLPPLISSLKVRKNHLFIKPNADFRAKYLKRNFFADYTRDIDLSRLDRSIVIMPFLMNVISIVWLSGQKYSVEVMDKHLFESLKTIKKLFRFMYPNTPFEGDVVPKKLVDNSAGKKVTTPLSDHLAVCFTCGLDSTFTSLVKRDEKQLLITLFQSHRSRGRSGQLLKMIGEHATRYGHTYTTVACNYEMMLNKQVLDNLSPEITKIRTDAIEGLGWVGVTAPILASKGISTLVIASSLAWDCPYFHAANPIVDESISFANVSVEHHGFDCARADKHEYIAQLVREGSIVRPRLRVCGKFRVGLNCEKCEKCLRTIHGCWGAGEDHRDYGFISSYKDAIERSHKILDTYEMRCYCKWHYYRICKKWRERKAAGQKVCDELADYEKWFLAYDFDRMKDLDVGSKQHINWRDLQVYASSTNA